MSKLTVELENIEALKSIEPNHHFTSPKLFGAYDYISLVRDVIQASAKAIVCRMNDEIVGYIPFFEKTTHDGLRLLNAQPFFGGHGGPYVLAKNAEPVIKSLLDTYSSYSKTFDFSNFVSIPGVAPDLIERCLPAASRHARLSQFCVFEDFESTDVMDHFHSKTRNMVRKAFKCGVEVVQADHSEDWQFF